MARAGSSREGERAAPAAAPRDVVGEPQNGHGDGIGLLTCCSRSSRRRRSLRGQHGAWGG